MKNVDNFEKVHIPTTTITIAGSIPRLIWKSMCRIPPVHYLWLHLCRISFSSHISIFLYQSRQFFLIASTFLYLFYFSSKTANYKVQYTSFVRTFFCVISQVTCSLHMPFNFSLMGPLTTHDFDVLPRLKGTSQEFWCLFQALLSASPRSKNDQVRIFHGP